MKVLVVDYFEIVRHSLEHLLSRHGHEVISAATGSEALEYLKSDKTIELVITDLFMPGMDGKELFNKARRIDRFDDEGVPKFILITSAERSSVNSEKAIVRDVQQALDLGFTDVLVKPIDDDYLLRRLCEIESPSEGQIVPVTASLEDARHSTPQVEQLSHHMRAVREIISCLAEKTDSSITHRDDVIRRLNELESLIPPAARD